MHLKKLLLTVFLCGLSLGMSQSPKILKVSYTEYPFSQHRRSSELIQSTPTKASFETFVRGITDYFSLYINLKDRSSVFVLDSTRQIRPIGWESPRTRAALLDTIISTVKTPENKTYKHEWIMEQTIFSEGKVGDIEWELTNETKNINGLECFKAEAKNFPMLTVWYTKELPVSNGPSIYQGLPGLVVFAESYSRTTQVYKTEYTDDVEGFEKLYNEKVNRFMEEKKQKTRYDREPLVMLKKGDLFLSSYKHFHGKPYRK